MKPLFESRWWALPCLVAAAALLTGCAGTRTETVDSEALCCRPNQSTSAQRALADSAASLVGARRIEINGRQFRYDCSGLAQAVYFSNGVDLYADASTHGGDNGVRLIRRYVAEHGRLHYGPTAQPGDLVFFHNTWDANRDGRHNDLWTHVGVVERVRSDGTIVFISRVSRGIERYRVNLQAPNQHRRSAGPILNDFMRRKRQRDPSHTQYLTGQLFASFGTLTH